MYPIVALVTAPAPRFSSAESFGRELLWLLLTSTCRRARVLRTKLSVEKYIADPAPVRIAEGRVPRHSCRIGEGPAAMDFRVVKRVAVAEEDGGACWRRVLRRSAGCKATAETRPPAPPERKCDLDFATGAGVVVVVSV
jgi:hypothetical protein